MEAVGKLTALSILAETSCRVGGAELRLIAGGAGDEGRGGGLYQGEQSLSQGKATSSTVTI